jgi:hypothetical protein
MKDPAEPLLIARWEPTPHVFGTINPSLIVIHESGTRITPGACVKYITAPKRTNPIRVGYHIVVERDGTIVQTARFDQKIRHAGRSSFNGKRWCNNFAIGIALVGPTQLKGTLNKAKAFFGRTFRAEDGLNDKGSSYHGKNHIWLNHTHDQMEALREVLRELRDRYPGIPITGHAYVSPGRKIDPQPMVGVVPSDFEKYAVPDPLMDEPVPHTDTPEQELAHAKDQIEEAPVIAVAESTDKVLKKQSREYRASNVLEKAAAGGAVVGATSEIAKLVPADATANLEYLKVTKSYMDTIGGMVAQHGVLFIVLACVGVFGAAYLIKKYKRQSYEAGLYSPSGEANET